MFLEDLFLQLYEFLNNIIPIVDAAIFLELYFPLKAASEVFTVKYEGRNCKATNEKSMAYICEKTN